MSDPTPGSLMRSSIAHSPPPATDRDDSRADDARVFAISRPDPALLRYYVLIACIIPPAAIVLLPLLCIRYRTLHYAFTEDGVSMRWGLLFRREVIVNYARIQDINLNSNIVERWLGLARIHLQTASGNAEAELTIEGIRDFILVRDFLYRHMQGRAASSGGAARDQKRTSNRELSSARPVTALVREAVEELRATRVVLARGTTSGPEEGRHV